MLIVKSWDTWLADGKYSAMELKDILGDVAQQVNADVISKMKSIKKDAEINKKAAEESKRTIRKLNARTKARTLVLKAYNKSMKNKLEEQVCFPSLFHFSTTWHLRPMLLDVTLSPFLNC